MSAPLGAHLIETPGPGGGETIVAELLSRVDRARFRQCAIIPDSTGWMARTVSSTDCFVLGPTPKSESGPLDVAYARGLRRIIRAVRPAVVRAHGFGTAFYAGLAVLGLPVRVIATFHGATDLDRTGWKTRFKWALVDRSDALICVSHSLKARHRGRAGRRGGRLSVIHNGVDFHCFTPGTRTALRRALDLPADALLVGVVGNVRAPKGYAVLLHSIAAARASGLRSHLAIAGDDSGILGDSLRELRSSLGLED